MFVSVGGDWRRGFDYAWQEPDPEPDEGPGLTWRNSPPALVRHLEVDDPAVTRDGDGRVAYLWLEDPPGLSPITTVGRYATDDEAQEVPASPGLDARDIESRREAVGVGPPNQHPATTTTMSVTVNCDNGPG
jgi:hypothetical protein